MEERKNNHMINKEMNQRIESYNQILQKKPIYHSIAQKMEEEVGDNPSGRLYISAFLPILLEYVSWVLREASNRKQKRLYFLARDGYQMYLVAQKLCEIWKLPIECRYLKLSRYSMRLPEYHLLEKKCLDHICIGGIDVTLKRIMKRAGLTDEEGIQIAEELGKLSEFEKILNYQEIMGLKGQLEKCPLFFEYVYNHSKAAYDNAIGYLKQEGLFDEIPYALVDSGWGGTLQKTISHLIDKPALEGYYFGMYEIPNGMSKEQYHSFFFDPAWGLKNKVAFSNCLFEAVFTSPEGMTLRYDKNNDSYVPLLDYEENPNASKIQYHCNLLLDYMSGYETVHKNTENKNLQKEKISSQKFVQKIVSKLMGHPTEWEAEEFGGLLFSDDVLEGNLKKVAADLTQTEIRQQHFVNKALIMLGIKQGELHESAWIEGSIVKEGHHVRSNLWHAALYKYFVYIKKMMK